MLLSANKQVIPLVRIAPSYCARRFQKSPVRTTKSPLNTIRLGESNPGGPGEKGSKGALKKAAQRQLAGETA